MRRDKHIYYELGGVIKKFGSYALVFVCSFGFASMIKNSIGNTYALNEKACPSGYYYVGATGILEDPEVCCPEDNNPDVGGYDSVNKWCATVVDKETGNCPNGYIKSGAICVAAAVEPTTSFTATFNPRYGSGGLQKKDCTIESDGKCYIYPTDLPTTTWEGYIFDGWSVDINCSSSGIKKEDNYTFTMTEDRTYYACWVDAYTATFNPNGGNGTSQEIQCSVADDNICYVYAKDVTIPTKERYIFNGWSLNSTATAGFKFDYNQSISSDVTYYATWKKGYTATFNSNGGKEKDQLVTCTGTNDDKCLIYAKDLPIATKEGYTFKGWSVIKGDTIGITSNNTTTVNLSEDRTYYAVWELNETEGSNPDPNPDSGNTGTGSQTPEPTPTVFTAIFNPNGGMGSVNIETCSTTTGSCDVPISRVPNPSKEGYYFNGWNTTSDCKNGLTSIILTQENTNFYACWEPVPTDSDNNDSGTTTPQTYTVTYKTNGGNESDKVLQCTIENDGKCYIYYKDVPVVTRNNYQFNGWTENFCPSVEVGYGDDSVSKFSVTKNTTYYACWIKKNTGNTETNTNQDIPKLYKLIINFGTNATCTEGNNIKKQVTLNYMEGQTVNYAIPTLEKYGFNSLISTPKVGIDVKDNKLSFTMPNQDVTLCFNYVKNPPTGSALIYLAWIIGLLSLGYTSYYILKVKRINLNK